MQAKTWTLRIAEVIKQRYPDAKIVFFGSRVRGDYLRDSDYDIIVVFPRLLKGSISLKGQVMC